MGFSGADPRPGAAGSHGSLGAGDVEPNMPAEADGNIRSNTVRIDDKGTYSSPSGSFRDLPDVF